MTVPYPPRLVLVGGWGFRASVWDAVIRHLPSDWRVEALSALDLLLEPDPVEALRRRLADGPAPAWVAGWSLGGMLVHEAVAGGAPAGRIALLASTPRFCAGDGQAFGVPAAELRALRRACRADAATTVRAFCSTCAASPAGAEALWAHAEPDHPGLDAGLHWLATRDLRGCRGSASVGGLVVHGERDAVIPAAGSQSLAEAWPGTTRRLEPTWGHDLPVADPARLAAWWMSPETGSGADRPVP